MEMSRMRKYRSFRFPTDFSTLMPEFSENFWFVSVCLENVAMEFAGRRLKDMP